MSSASSRPTERNTAFEARSVRFDRPHEEEDLTWPHSLDHRSCPSRNELPRTPSSLRFLKLGHAVRDDRAELERSFGHPPRVDVGLRSCPGASREGNLAGE
jgi:hypothetical protein